MFFGTEMEPKILKTTSQLRTSTKNFSEDSPEEPLIKNRFFGAVPLMVGFAFCFSTVPTNLCHSEKGNLTGEN
jgi:hypothetical protein